MPEDPKPSEDQDGILVKSELIRALDPQPCDQRNFVFLQGYVGEVTEEWVRIYPKLDLRTYFNVPRKEIKFTELVDPDRPSSQVRLVVESTVQIDVVKHGCQTFDAGYLSGAIAATHLPGAQPEPAEAMGARAAAPAGVLLPCTPPAKMIISPPPHSTCASPCHTAPLFGS
jgi:hypothetical protein